jgi:capsule polysaccharide modification protein KpsS
MTKLVFVSINGNNMVLKISQFASDKELHRSLVRAILDNGVSWLPKYFKTNRYQIASDAITKMVYASKVQRFLKRYLQIREQISARIIQRCWRRCIVDPSYVICYRRLMNEYNEIKHDFVHGSLSSQ